MNKVIAGNYEGKGISCAGGQVAIAVSIFQNVKLNSSTVDAYELITDEHRKSAASGIGRGIVGGVLLGPVGMIGGALLAKNKGIYQVAIQFKDGSKSLIEIDDKVYKVLVKALF